MSMLDGIRRLSRQKDQPPPGARLINIERNGTAVVFQFVNEKGETFEFDFYATWEVDTRPLALFAGIE